MDELNRAFMAEPRQSCIKCTKIATKISSLPRFQKAPKTGRNGSVGRHMQLEHLQSKASATYKSKQPLTLYHASSKLAVLSDKREEKKMHQRNVVHVYVRDMHWIEDTLLRRLETICRRFYP